MGLFFYWQSFSENFLNVFKPSDGLVGITPGDHSKFEELKELGCIFGDVLAGQKAKIKLLVAINYTNDIDTMKNLVRKICENYHLPYFTFSPTFSICPTHGYISGEHEVCPDCSEECEVYSRIVGYIRPVKQWNKGKKTEFKNRKTFDMAKAEECCSCL